MQIMSSFSPSDNYVEDTSALTRMVMRLFQHWKLSSQEQSLLLSLSAKTRSSIARYRNGASTLSPDRDTHDRVKYLLSIHKSLRTIFPYNRELVYEWPKAPNKYFDGKTPVQVMVEEGFLGVVRVDNYLKNYLAK